MVNHQISNYMVLYFQTNPDTEESADTAMGLYLALSANNMFQSPKITLAQILKICFFPYSVPIINIINHGAGHSHSAIEKSLKIRVHSARNGDLSQA